MSVTTSRRRFAAFRLSPVLLAACAAFAAGSADAACPPGTKAWMSRGKIICLKPGYAPSAEEQCDSLLTTVTPASEASRVYGNCVALVTGRGFVTCPDGRQVAPEDAKLCSGK